MSALTDPWIPRGRVASTGEVTSVTSGFTAETLYGGISDFSFTATVGRRYLVMVKAQVASTVSGDSAVVSVRDNGTSAPTTSSPVLFDWRTGSLLNGAAQPSTMWFEWAPSAGQHRLALSVRQSTGTGTLTVGDSGRGTVVRIVDDGPA